MKIVVIGGSGLIGSKVVAKLAALGHEALAASPRSGVNSVTGEGLAAVLKGASVVVDVSNAPSWEAAAVLEFFRASTGNLLAQEAAAGVGHHVALSVVGTELLLESGYFPAKLAQEEMIQASPIPYSIVRATQFFEFVQAIGEAGLSGEVFRMPDALIQPIASGDVASAVCEIALGAPLNRTVEIGGPKAFRIADLIRLDRRSRGDAREVVADAQARYFGAALSERALVPGEGAQLGKRSFEEWLIHPTA